ncbi:MAG: DUF427 domain-containing protein [Acidimicrobiales bacterium]
MGLTVGSGPFGPKAEGRHNATADDRFVLVEPFARRVRAVWDGRTVVDSDAVSMVHAAGSLPRYSFPGGDVTLDGGTEEDPEVPGNVTVAWDAVDAWYEEDERVFVHPRDPYHRVDSFLTPRCVEVQLGGTPLARSTRARMLCETSLPPRWYLPRADVTMEQLLRSSTVTQCPYKGAARYWSARRGDHAVDDVVWSYEDEVRGDGVPVQWLLAFDDLKVEVVVDGVRQGA